MRTDDENTLDRLDVYKKSTKLARSSPHVLTLGGEQGGAALNAVDCLSIRSLVDELSAPWDRPTIHETKNENRILWERLLRETSKARSQLLDDRCLTRGTFLGKGINFNDILDLSKEGLRMQNLKHEHVLGLIGIAHDEYYRPVLVSEFMECGDLLTFLREKGESLNIETLLGFAHKIALGMEYLHVEAKMVHRDLAARNCILPTFVDLRVANEQNVKVADFGLSRFLNVDGNYVTLPTKTALPWAWCAVELFTRRAQTFNQKTDVWSYGIVLWEITTSGAVPYEDVPTRFLKDALQKGERLPRPNLCLPSLYDIMLNCWSGNPQSRNDFCVQAVSIAGVISSMNIEATAQQPQNPNPNEHDTESDIRFSLATESVTFVRNTEGSANEKREPRLIEESASEERETPLLEEKFTAISLLRALMHKGTPQMRKRVASLVAVCLAAVAIAAVVTLTSGERLVDKCLATSVFIVGGQGDSDSILPSVEIFDSQQNTFSESASLPDGGKSYIATAAVGKTIYAIGGFIKTNGTWKVTSSVQRLDAHDSRSNWTSLSNMPSVRGSLAVVASSTKIFVLGGNIGGRREVNTLETFEPNTGKWTSLSGMTTPRQGLVAGLIGEFLYAAGGGKFLDNKTDNAEIYNVVEKYSIRDDGWSSITRMKFRRLHACSAVLDAKLFVIGGTDGLIALSTVEVYNPVSNEWTSSTDMSTGRSGCGAVALGDLIYVFGGVSERKKIIDTVEVYNGRTKSWKILPANMRERRAYFGVAAVCNSETETKLSLYLVISALGVFAMIQLCDR